MPTAVYSGRCRVLVIRKTGTRLPNGVPTEVTAEEAEIVGGRSDVSVRDAAGKSAASKPKPRGQRARKPRSKPAE